MLKIDKFSHVPLYEQVMEQITLHIRLGVYAKGEPLPSVRALSAELGINPNTLQKAYAELERQGLTISVPGSGRYVSEQAEALFAKRAGEELQRFGALARTLYDAGIPRARLIQQIDCALPAQAGEQPLQEQTGGQS